MVVGVMELHFRIFNSFSLKDKRRVLKSLMDRTRRNFNVSIAETGNNDMLNLATIGISCISNSRVKAESVLDRCLDFYINNYEIEVVNVRKDFL